MSTFSLLQNSIPLSNAQLQEFIYRMWLATAEEFVLSSWTDTTEEEIITIDWYAMPFFHEPLANKICAFSKKCVSSFTKRVIVYVLCVKWNTSICFNVTIERV